MKIEIISAEKNNFRVRCESEDFINDFMGQFSFSVGCVREKADSDVFSLYSINKSEVAVVRAALLRHDAPAETVPAQSGSRRVALASDAVAQQLNHGKSWVASAHDVDSKFLPSEWEGELICYVYE